MPEDTDPTATVDSPETAAPESAAVDEGTPVDGDETQPEEWDSWEAFTKSQQFAPVRGLYDAYDEDRQRATYKAAFDQADQALTPLVQEQVRLAQNIERLHQSADEGLRSINGRIKKGLEDGTISDADSFVEALKSHAPTWNALQAIGIDKQKASAMLGYKDESGQIIGGYEQGVRAAAIGVMEDFVQRISAEVGDPKLLELKPRVLAVINGQEQPKAFVKSLADSLINIGYRKGLQEGRKPSAESAKIESRNVGGPDTGNPSGGSGRNTYRTKAEAASLHIQGRISNAQMREVNANPNIPE